MSNREHAYERLVAINPATTLDDYTPTADDAAAFLRRIEEESMDTKTRERLEPLEPHRPRRPWLAGAVAFAAVIIVLGVVSLWPGAELDEGPGSGTNAPPPPTEAKPDPEADPTALAVIDELVAAYNSGSWQRYRAVFADGAVARHDDADSFMKSASGVYEWGTLEQVYRWATMTGSRYGTVSCDTSAGALECDIDWSHPVFVEFAGPRRLSITATVTDNQITDYTEEISGNDFVQDVQGFQTWVRLNAEDYVEAMFAGGFEPRFDPHSAALWNALLPEYTGNGSGLPADELDVVVQLVDTLNSGRIDDYMGLFVTDIAFTFPDRGGPDVPQGAGSGTEFSSDFLQWRQQKLWEIWLGGWTSISGCEPSGSGAICSITYADDFVSRAMGQLKGTAAFSLSTDGRITSYSQDWGASGETYDQWVMSFFDWVEREHPEQAVEMGRNIGLDPSHTPQSARLWDELSAEFLGRTGG